MAESETTLVAPPPTASDVRPSGDPSPALARAADAPVSTLQPDDDGQLTADQRARRRGGLAPAVPTEAEREVNEIARSPEPLQTPPPPDAKLAQELQAAYAEQAQQRRRRLTKAQKADRAQYAASVESSKDRVAAKRARETAQALAVLQPREPTFNTAPTPNARPTTSEETRPNPVLENRLPPEILAQYIATRGKGYAHRSDPSVVQFRDYGDALRAETNSLDTADTLVSIARDRGFENIKVRGSDAFRREVWLEAMAREIKVSGYTPEPRDWEEMARRAKVYGKSENVIERGDPTTARELHHPEAGMVGRMAGPEETLRAVLPALYAKSGVKVDEPKLNEAIHRAVTKRRTEIDASPAAVAIRPVEGTVIAAGVAPYQFEAGRDPSYFVRLVRDNGEVFEKWGKALGAISSDLLRTGTKIEIVNRGAKAVEINAKRNDLHVIAKDTLLVDSAVFLRRAAEMNAARDAQVQQLRPTGRTTGLPTQATVRPQERPVHLPRRDRGR